MSRKLQLKLKAMLSLRTLKTSLKKKRQRSLKKKRQKSLKKRQRSLKIKIQTCIGKVKKGLRARHTGNPSRKFRQRTRKKSDKKMMPVKHPKLKMISKSLAIKLGRKMMSKILASKLRPGQGS